MPTFKNNRKQEFDTLSLLNKHPYKVERTPLFVWIVIIPTILFYMLFQIAPIGMSLVGSFYKWNPLRGQFNFTGVNNYFKAYSSPLFWQSMANNLVFTSSVVLFRTLFGLALAVLILNLRKTGGVFRAIYFLPVITSMVAVALVWKWMYDPLFGLVNHTIRLFGFHGRAWLKDADTALGAISIMTIWKESGYAMVIFTAGLLGLPSTVFEAARIDGASRYQSFIHITIPLLRPTTLFVVITSLITYLQTFVQVFIMTEGGPGTATFLTTFMIYEEAFTKFNFGYASAISFNLFIVIMILTWIQFKLIRER